MGKGPTISAPLRDSYAFWALAALIVAAFLLGGSARDDVLGLAILRPVAAICLGIGLFGLTGEAARHYRWPLLAMGAVVLLTLIHLIPLPPSVWMALPGRELAAEAARAGGIEQPWRPIALVPWRGWNALFALMIQVTGIVLFYLVMVSTMVVDRQAGEIALLKSRGASTGQVMLVFLAEGLGIAIVATVLGPFLAVGAISILGLTPPFEPLSGGDLLDVPLSPWAFLLAAGGGLMALVALLIPAYRASKLSITNYKQQVSRPQTQPLFFRYYLDLAVVAVAAFAFYQLRQRGSFVSLGSCCAPFGLACRGVRLG